MRRSLVIPVFLLLSLSASAQRHRATMPPPPAGSPRISEEFPIGELAYGPMYTQISSPRIASAPDQSLVVWSGSGGTMAERIDSGGRPLDAAPISLVGQGQPAYPADVVWDGSHYVVLATSYSESGWILRLIGISASGRIDSNFELTRLAEQPIALSMTRHSSGEYAVAYMTYTRDGQHAVGAFIAAASGRILQQLSFGIPPGFQSSMRIASSPSGYLLAWDGGGAVIALHGASSKTISLPNGEYDLAWNGSDYFAVRSDYTWDGTTATYSIRGLHVTQDGKVSPSVVIHTAPNSAHFPTVIWRNGDYVVLWKQQSGPPTPNGQWYLFDLYETRLSADGTVLEERLLATNTDSYTKWGGRVDSPALAMQGSRTIYIWSAQQAAAGAGYDSPRDLWAVETAADALPVSSLQAQRVTSKAMPQSIVSVTAAAGSARVFWIQSPTYSGVNAQNASAAIDLSGRATAVAPLPPPLGALFARSGTGTVTVARENTAPYRLMQTTVDANGIAAASVAIIAPASGTTASPLGLACGSSECALVYSTIVGSASDTTKCYLQRFTPSGALIGSAVDVPTGFRAISAMADQYLLLFQWPMQDHNVVVSRFAEGKLSDITTLVPQTNTYSGAIASNGKEWLVVWSGMRDSRGVMTAFRIDAAGNIASQTDITLQAGGYLTRFAATWDGRDWIVAWAQSGPQLLNDIRAARIAPDGALVDAAPAGDGFGVAATVDDEYAFSIDSAGDGLSALAYSRATTEQKYGQTSRVFVRWIDNR